MNKWLIIFILMISLVSCDKKTQNQEIDKIAEEVSDTSEIVHNFDSNFMDGLKIWELIINKKFEDLSKYISIENGLLISTEGLFNPSYDIKLSQDDVLRINNDDTIHELYFSAVGEKLPFTNKQIFDQFFSFPINRITEINLNYITTRDYIYDEYSVSSVLDCFPADSQLVDIFLEPEEEGSMDWYHIFLVLNYVDKKTYLSGLGIAYKDF